MHVLETYSMTEPMCVHEHTVYRTLMIYDLTILISI